MNEQLSQKSAYRFKQLSGVEEHTERLEQCFVVAFQKGYSVIEIARIAGMKSAKYIHAALVKHGQIMGAKRGRQSKYIIIPEGLVSQLEIRQLSFAQWCTGWSLEQGSAASEINKGAGLALESVRRDFPNYYSKLTGAKVEDFVSGPPFERHNFSVNFDFDGIESGYKAEIKELGICVYGNSYQAALHRALIQRRQQMALSRLEDLPYLTGTRDRELIW